MTANEILQNLKDEADFDGTHYHLEWDLVLTELELIELAQRRAAEVAEWAGVPERPLMQAHAADGSPALWPMDTELTYTFAEDSFERLGKPGYLEQARAALATACGDWAEALPELPIRPAAEGEEPLFEVRMIARRGGLLARAFFPDAPAENRVLRVCPPAFESPDTYPLDGVFRHELGHVLGFRHEHIRPESGMRTREQKDNTTALTGYDEYSVMHYPKPPANQGPYRFGISKLDRQGARRAYGVGDLATVAGVSEPEA